MCNCTDPLLMDAQPIKKTTKLKNNLIQGNFCGVKADDPDRVCVNNADYSNYDSACNCQSDCHTSQYKVIYLTVFLINSIIIIKIKFSLNRSK